MANAAEWTERVAAWRASGLSAEKFCEGKGYSTKSLWHWSSKLGRSNSKGGVLRQETVRLARVVRPALPAASVEHPGIVLVLAGARMEVRGRVDPIALRAVVQALRDGQPEAST